jgi:hypothetical protein
MRTALLVLVVGVIGLAAAGCGARHTRGANRTLTSADVKKAFDAENVPLRVVFENRGAVTLIPADGSDRYSVIVYDPSAGDFGVRSQVGNVLVDVRNVFISYRPRSSSASRVRAAIGRLRRMS